MGDIKLACRQLAKTPGFTLIAVLVLALGIGANGTIVSIINSVLFKPLCVPNPDQLVGVYQQERDNPDAFSLFSYPDFKDLSSTGETAFKELFAFRFDAVGLRSDLVETVPVAFVSQNYFAALGVKPFLGRALLPDDGPSGLPVAVLTHSFWTRLGGDPSIIGRKMKLVRGEITVVGVMPPGFTGAQGLSPKMFLPLETASALEPDVDKPRGLRLTDRADRRLMLMGRLKSGVTLANADAAMSAWNQQFSIPDPAKPVSRILTCRPSSRFNFSPQPSRSLVGLVPVATFAFGLSLLVLTVACLNLANMMLARGATRRTEIAIRLALGAGCSRVLKQLLTEGAMLAAMGGAAGLLVSLWATHLLRAFLYSGAGMPADFPDFDLSPDWRVVWTLLLLAGLATVLFALGPAWRLTRVEVSAELKHQTVVGTRKPRSAALGLREFLAVGQVAFSVALLAAALLFSRSAMNVASANPGFEFGSTFYLSLDPGMLGYSAARTHELRRAALERLKSLPGVESVSAATSIPFGNSWDVSVVQVGGAPQPAKGAATFAAGKELYAINNAVGPDYFHAIGLPLQRGTEFETHATADPRAPAVAIISQGLAEQFWPGEDPVGRTVQFPGPVPRLMTVVGVVPEVDWQVFRKEKRPQIYVPFSPDFAGNFKIHVRVAPGYSSTQLMTASRQVLFQIDPQAPLTEVKTLANLHRDGPTVRVTRFGSALFGAFGVLALVLSLLGLYAAKAYAVARRTREIGIRMALGATRREVLSLILNESSWLLAAGLALGLTLAFIVGRVATSFLYQVSNLDPLTFTAVPALMLATGLLACFIPARRAARLDPMSALRYE
jgi:predicted permease